jgi:hypothetical protein
MKYYEVGAEVFLKEDLFACREISPFTINYSYQPQGFYKSELRGIRYEHDELLPYPPKFTLDYYIRDEELHTIENFVESPGVRENTDVNLKIWPGGPGQTFLRVIFKNITDSFYFGIELGKAIQKDQAYIKKAKIRVQQEHIEYYKNQNEIERSNAEWNRWQEEQYDKDPRNH